MADASLEWKGDFGLTPDGDLLMVGGSDETRQAIIRRLLTAVRGYVWATEYGAGIPERIGKPARERAIQAIVRAQIALEATVASVPVPKITVTQATATPGLFAIAITYSDAVTGAAVAISLEVPGSR
jgi:phage baseplate assembly protein W